MRDDGKVRVTELSCLAANSSAIMWCVRFLIVFCLFIMPCINVSDFTNDLEGKAKSFGTNLVNNALENALGGGAASILKSLLGGQSAGPGLKTSVNSHIAKSCDDWRARLSLPPAMADEPILKA